VGTLTLGSGLSNVSVTGPGATLTFGSASLPSFARPAAGAAVNFASPGTVAAPNVTLDAGGLIGGWATIGNVNSSSGTNVLDFATVSGGLVTATTNYNTGAIGTWTSTSNVQVSLAQAPTGSTPVNSVYLTGAGRIGVATTAYTLTVNNGGIIVNAATGSYTVNGNLTINNAAGIGGAAFSAAATADNVNSTITVGPGIPDLVITTASNLQINGLIKDGPSPGALSATTTTGSNVVTVSSTSLLYPGVTVTGLSGLTGTQTVTSVIDATHFTVANSATTGGTASATFTSHTGLTKNGTGILDLADGNNASLANTFSGLVTINGGTLLVRADSNFGAVPAAATPNAITLNGGTILTTAGFTLNGNRGITVGPQGGTFGYIGGSTFTFGSVVTGPGGFTFSSNGFNTNNTTYNLNTGTGSSNYQGATVLITKSGNGTGNITWQKAEQIPDASPVTIQGSGPVNMAGFAETIGSLSSATLVGQITNLGAFTVGQNNLSASYGGTITGTAATTSITKIGAGIQTLGGTVSLGTGAGNVVNIGTAGSDGGGLVVGSGLTASAVNVGFGTTHSGSLGGGGTINANVLVNALGHLAPSLGSSGTSTLTVSGNLTLNAGATLDYHFSTAGLPGSGDMVTQSAGNLSLNTGADTLNITQLSNFGIGTYTLFTNATGTITTNGASSLPGAPAGALNFTINGNANFNYWVLGPGSAIDPSAGGGTVPLNQVVLEVLQGNPQLTWKGNVDGNWNTTTANWIGQSTVFTPGSNVTFDDIGIGRPGVTVAAGGVSVNTLSVASSSGTYTFGGGPITVTGAAGLTKSQGGSVTFNNNVTTSASSAAPAHWTGRSRRSTSPGPSGRAPPASAR
jgi:hypothetical protein